MRWDQVFFWFTIKRIWNESKWWPSGNVSGSGFVDHGFESMQALLCANNFTTIALKKQETPLSEGKLRKETYSNTKNSIIFTWARPSGTKAYIPLVELWAHYDRCVLQYSQFYTHNLLTHKLKGFKCSTVIEYLSA